jgi:hypothetical protein
MSGPSTNSPEKAIPQHNEKDRGGAAVQQPNSEDSEVSDVAELQVAGEDTQNLTPGLPFSKARAIALVATLTGASFLNVSQLLVCRCFVRGSPKQQSLSGQAVVIILPTIGKDLNIPEARLQWILSAYSLTFGCFLLFWGRVGDIYGKRKIFIWGSAWFAATTLVNPFLPNEIAFDLFRGLQGLVSIGRLPLLRGKINR